MKTHLRACKGIDYDFRSWKLGRLYFRFIKGTELELSGWTAERLGELLAGKGFIKILTGQTKDPKGRYEEGHKRFVECEGKFVTKKQVLDLVNKSKL